MPLLYIAQNIIIVGDEKQLSAITNINENNIKSKVKDEYNYAKENFLSSIAKTINPPSQTLLEHYRCDYNIINYCNKFFYDNQLKIYIDAKQGAMSLVDQNKGKYVEKIEYMEIPLLRVSSKNTWDIEEFERKVKAKMGE